MKKLYYIRTNANDEVFYIDGNHIRVLDDYYFENQEHPFDNDDEEKIKQDKALRFLQEIEDVSGWSTRFILKDDSLDFDDDYYSGYETAEIIEAVPDDIIDSFYGFDVEVIAELEVEDSLL